MGDGYVDWMHLAQDRKKRRAFVNKVLKLNFPQNSRKFLTRRRYINFCKTLQCGVSSVVVGLEPT